MCASALTRRSKQGWVQINHSRVLIEETKDIKQDASFHLPGVLLVPKGKYRQRTGQQERYHARALFWGKEL